ncbi:AGAP001194-PA-like protein [Anopheles sinensis]|uniref:AGAP001194-PA-like protein n=1 Tax=Anopheles sinensis TaxID=74873 RepID=A0A084W0D0_ANOSI|nr:AGAP001194-PA-like protein [Anopheles sinensis]
MLTLQRAISCERLIQYASENLVTEILIHPQVNTFIQCIRNLLSSFTRHRHIIHTGYTFSGNGSWILQDGTFSVVDFMEAFQEHEVQRVLRAYPDTITMDVHCAPTGQWHTIQDKSFSRLCQIRLNPVDVLDSGSEKLNAFVAYVSSMIIPTEISELLESSDVVGNIRFSHPTLYVFPGGQGDAALFGINGFNMLVDGGFSRKSCFWDFVRHLDRLDAVLMTRINNTNIKGISSVVERKSEAHVYPQIGHFFCNIPERKGLPSPDGDKDRDPLLVDLLEEGHQIVTNLKSLNLKAQNCYRESEPINLYHKVGHGTLDMYVISPSRDSREVKDFLARWTAADQRLFAKETKDGKDFAFPLQNLISICALLVWTPANPEDNITRILFPGSAPEYKILEGLEKMKNVEFMRQPVCPVKSISASLSTPVLVTKKSLKSASTDRILAEPIHASKPKDNKLIDNKMKMMQTDNKLTADAMDSSADEGKMEKQLGSKGPSATTTVATAKVESKPKPIRRPASTAAEKKIDNKKLEQQQQQQDEKKDSISDVGSDKEDQTLPKPSVGAVTAVDSEKSIDEGPAEVSEKKPDTDAGEIKPEAEVKEKKKELSPPAGADTGGAAVTKSTKKPPVSRTPAARSRVDTSSKTKASTERKPVERKKQPEPNKSSPTTPKKAAPADSKLTNGSATKAEHADEVKRSVSKVSASKPAPITAPKTGKSSPKATPAKSAKDENNRKVLEARQRPSAATAARREAISARKEAEKKPEAAKPQTERKPISRRPKGTAGVAGSSAALGGSPVKAKKVLKSEKDAVIRKAKLDKNGTTDSSLVSTPSADEGGVAILKRPSGTPEVMAGEGDSLEVIKQQQQQQQLAELKEEQEAVREIEAVFNRDTAAQKAQKHRELALTEEHREVQDSTTEPEEEEEYLIIEKEEQYTEDSINEPESSATKEEEIQKHQRDSQESEKRKRDSLVEEKGEEEMEKDGIAESTATVQIVNGTKAESEQPQGKVGEDEEQDATEEEQEEQELEEEVQEIIASAKEIAKSKMETSMDGLKTEEISSISPDDKMSSTKKTSDTRDENEEHELQAAGHLKEHIDPPHHESHHEERVSATVESGATTTAPTLPEDERIPLDEIKEDLVIEEKHVREVTKEIEVAAVTAVTTAAEAEAGPEKASRATPAAPEASATAPLPTVYEPLERPTPAKMQFSAQQAHMRDVVKTPDEVADLPVHEEADLEEGYGEDKDKDSKEDEEKDRDTKEKPEEEPTMAGKETDGKQPEKTDDDRQVADKADESDKPCDTAKKAAGHVEPLAVEEDIIEKVARDTQQEMALKTDAHQEPEEKAQPKDDVDILQDLESQIIPMEVVKEKMEKVEKVHQQLHTRDGKKTPEAEPETDDETKLPVEEEIIVAQKVVPKVPLPTAESEAAGQDDIWKTPAKAEEKLDELKHLIDDKAKSTVSELVTLKDTMVKTVVERKDEIVEQVTAELQDVDHKIKESVTDAGKELEQMAADAAVEVVKDVTEQADAVIDSLQMKAKQVDENLKLTAGKLDEKIESVVANVSQITSKADETLATIATEASELEKMAKELKKDVAGQLDDTKKQLEQELTKGVELAQEKAKGGISSFFGGITEGIKSGIEKMADKMEHKIKDKTEQVEEKLQQVTEKIDALKTEREQEVASKSTEPVEQAFDRFGPYERSFTQELRETHITTVDSPVMDGDKLSMELKSMVNIPHDIHEDKELEELEDNKNLGTFVIEDIKYSAFEDANLREIKEEEDEDRVSPPQGMVEKLGPGMVGVMPPRARTPEDVAKIVANVAEVLKSDKDLEEIIPGFDPQEARPREEDVGTVQRMLVTASSEDGGEETVICEDGTITFSKSATPEPIQGSGKSTPEVKVQEEDEDELIEELERQKQKKDKEAVEEKKPVEAEKSSPGSSGKSSPDLKTSPTSIEEKDKHELPEKVVQVDATKAATNVASDLTSGEIRKESIADQQHPVFGHIDDQRRESAISTFSERDYTKDESSFVDERDSSRAHSISSHISDLKEDAADLKSVADFLKESEKEPDHVFGEGDSKMKDLSSPESVTSQKTISEKEPKIADAAEKAKVDAADTKELPMPTSKEASRPASAMSEKDSTHSKDTAANEVEASEFSRPESPASAGEASRPGSAMDDQKKDDSKTVEVTRHLKESASLDLAGEQPETTAFSRPESPASTGELSPAEAKVGVQEDSRPPSAASDTKAPSEKSIDIKTEQKQDSRPASAVPSDKSVDLKEQTKEESRPTSAAASEKSAELKEIQNDVSRPASSASVTEEKRPSEASVDLKLGEKEISRPASAASEVKAPSEKSDDLKGDEKEDSRPASAIPSEKSVDLKVEQKDESRPESAASATKAPSEKSVDLKDDQKGDSRPPSAVPSEKSVDLKPESKEESRPTSAASETKVPSEKSLDLKADQSRPASAASEGKAPSEKSVDLKADQKEDSRPTSAAPSEKSLEAKADEKEESRPASAAPSEKSVDLKDIQKDDSRPASAASEKDGKVLLEKSDDLKVERKEESRPESAASGAQAPSEKSVDLKADQKEDSRPASAVPSEKSVDLKPEQKEQSRPASAASEAKTPSEKSVDLKEDQKDGSRPTSAVPSEKSVDLKEGPQEESRPASAVPSEKSIDMKEDHKYESRPASVTPSEKTGEIKAEQKEVSRPASAVPSEKSVDLNLEKKEESRPASAVPSEKSDDQKNELNAGTLPAGAMSDQKDESRPTSAVPSEKSVDITTDHKEVSRPASAASGKEATSFSVKEEAVEFSRPESPASAGEASRPGSAMEDQKKVEEEKIVEVTRHLKESASLDLAEELAETTAFSRPESPVSTGEHSRPASAQPEEKSDKPLEPTSEGKDSRSPSVASVTVDLKAEFKDSRPPSAVPSEKSVDLKPEQKEVSRPGSAASDAKPPSEKSDDLKTEHHEESRPTSAVPSEKSVELKAEDKEVSRPASAASEAKAPSEKSIDLKDQKEGSRPASTVPSEKSIDLKGDQKEESRPGSAVSGSYVPTETSELKTEQKDESRPASTVPSEKSLDLKPEEKQDSRPGSAASDAKAPLDRASPSHLQTESKEQSRPASSASVKDSSPHETVDSAVKSEQKDSPTQSAADKAGTSPIAVMESVQKEDYLQAASTEHSRPASAASDRSEKNQAELSRPASKLSGTVDGKSEKSPDISKEPSRPESAASEKAGGASDGPAAGAADKSKQTDGVIKEDKPVETDLSRPDSAATHVSESLVSDKLSEHSRPLSAMSNVSDKVEVAASTMAPSAGQQSVPGFSSRPDSAASQHSATEKHVEMSSTVVQQETSQTTQISAGASKEPSRPASAASVKSTTSETKKKRTKCPPFRQERPTSALSGGDEEEHDNDEKICLKETRSKSMSAVMSSNVQRAGFEGSTLGVLEESMITSRDDLDMLRSPRDSVTKIDASLTQKLTETTSTSSLATKSFKPLFDDTPQFPAAKVEEEPSDREKESTVVFPKCGLDSTESPEHGPTIAQGMDQLLKDTVSTMKEIEKMTSSVITSTVQMKKEGSALEQMNKSETSAGLAFPVSDSGKSSPYLGDKSHESSAKSVSPQPDKDSLEESSTSLNTFIEKDSLSEGITKQQKELVSIRMSPVGESVAERESVPVTQSHKASEELLFAGSKTPPTAPISPNVAVKEEVSHGTAMIMQSQIDSSILSGSTSSAITMTAASTTATTGAAVPKDDASGISTPKESVPSGKSSPGLMSVHTQGSTDSASKSINLGHSSSGIETSDSSPKPTSPFPKVVVVDTLKLADETKTTSGMSTPDMTRSSTPDMVDSQIERIAPAATSGEKSDSQQTFTTTTTTTKTTTYIIKDGQKIEVDSNVHSDTVSEPTKEAPAASTGSVPAGSSTTTTTTTTSYILKDGQKVEESSVSSTKPSVPAQLTLAATEQHTLAEEYDEKEILSPRSDISSGQASRIVAAWHDEDVPGSPMSVTSQAPLSPSTKYTYDYDLQHSSSGVSKKSDIEIDQDSQDDIVPPQYGSDEAKAALPLASSFKPDPMSTSFYGQLPEVTPITSTTLASSTTRSVPIPIAGSGKGFSKTYVEYASSGDSSVDSSHKPSMATDSDRKYLDDADLDFEKTFSRGKMEDLMTTSMHFSSEKEFMAATTTAAKEQAQKKEMDFTSTGLPSSATTTVVASAQPTVTTTLPQSSPQSQAQSQSTTTMLPQSTSPQPTAPPTASAPSSSEVKSVLDSWGKPLSLPSPAPMATEDNKTTPKKERRMLMSKTKLNNEKNLRKRAESPSKAAAKKPASPVYVDLSYVPHHGNSYYANVEFFKRVRARYYVFSGTEPSREVYNALLEAKQTWEDKELEVTIIPTYDTDVLGYWVSENEELLAKYHIDLSPSAARCTINLQDHETSCSAYRLEF